jgi:hypothetical protein
MNNLEIITADNAERILEVGPDLAEAYKIAFAGDPWYEVSKCVDLTCGAGLSGRSVSDCCPECKGVLEEAYDTEELISSWQSMATTENALFEVAFLDGRPQRATIARPTNPAELFERKYATVSGMKPWLAQKLPEAFVWIEDTFANRNQQASGNLRERGATLGRVAQYFSSMEIVTRTLSPAIVAATLRDMWPTTVVYMGSDRVGESVVNQTFSNPGYTLPSVPDRRTLLNIKNASWRLK